MSYLGVAESPSSSLAPLLACQIKVAPANVDARVGVEGVVVVELVQLLRKGPSVLHLYAEAGRPVVIDLRRPLEPPARRFHRVIDGVDVLLCSVVPKIRGIVDLAIHSHGHFFVALANSRSLELGDPVFKIGATIATEIGCSHRLLDEDYRPHCTQDGSEREAAGSLRKSPDHDPLHFV